MIHLRHARHRANSGKSSNTGLCAPTLIAILVLIASSLALAEGPCDIYAAATTPCVAAHSTARALFAAYNGPLYQVTRTSDKATKDIGVLSVGGVANVATQDSFLNDKAGTISIIYDQTSNHNDMKKSPKAFYLRSGGLEADAAKGLALVGGHLVHGIQVDSNGVAYRNNATKGVAIGDEAEAMYAVVDGKRYSTGCCFDYGNAETTGNDDGNGTMEAIYWGTNVSWGGPGEGNGPWVAADLENGMFKSDTGGHTAAIVSLNNKSVIAEFATAMLKGPSGNKMGIKAGDAQAGKLVTMWDGPRPRLPGYTPKKLQGAIIIGTGGDGSKAGVGTFFEGAMTIGNPPDSVDDKIQANIVAAGYSRLATSIFSRPGNRSGARLRYSRLHSRAVVEFDQSTAGRTDLEIVDLRGMRVANITAGEIAAGPNQATWDASNASNGIYIARLVQNGTITWSDRIFVGK